MKISSVALWIVTTTAAVDAFVLSPFVQVHKAAKLQHPRVLSATRPNLDEFDHLLQEGGTTTLQQSSVSTRRRILLPDQERAVQLTSSAVLSEQDAAAMEQTETSESETTLADPYDDVFAEQLNKIQEYEDQQAAPGFNFNDYLKNSDLGDLAVTLAIPAIVLLAVGKWGSGHVYTFFEEKADTTLDSFAKEMIYHDGDFEEMKLCHKDYTKRLMWLGPRKTDAMLRRYLEAYAKKKTVSPQSISSLSFVFSLFNLSEEKAAQTLVGLCQQMGTDKISSAGKLLFFGSRILKSPEGKRALQPIKTLIKSTYRDEEVAETLVDTSQQAIGEAAYRAAVLEGGKNQSKLTVGWEVLGLNREAAERIFQEEAKEGFVSYREAMYGGQSRKYDAKGNQLDEEGKPVDPEAAAEAEKEAEQEASSNVYECGNCGYTLFIAQGREFKFYGDDFTCPECGAKKDEFNPKDLEE